MPLYEYVCGACRLETEQLRKLSDPPLVVCPSCGAPQMTKKISLAAFRLKGGGWYETDFKKNGQRQIAGDKPDGDSAKGDTAKKEGGEGKAKSNDDKGASKPSGDKTEKTKKDVSKTANG